MSNRETLKRTRDAAELGTGEPPAKRGINVNHQGPKDTTALHLAAGLGHEDIVGLLLVHGADITLKNEDGMTALDLAKSEGHESVAQLLEEWKQFKCVMNEAKKTEAKKTEAKTAEAKTAETPAYTPPPKGVYEGVFASLDGPYVPTSPLDGMPYDISL